MRSDAVGACAAPGTTCGTPFVSDAVNPPLFAGEVAVLQTVLGGRYELSARKQQGPDRGLVAAHAEA